MAKAGVDTRRLKDEVAESLKKQRWDKAADTLEKLVSAEPKDMQHRLRLGDAYRRMEQVQKSVAAYQAVARHYGDEGQLIKAIGAVKMILEIDPRNAEAQRQLREMNGRRFGKPTLADVGMKPSRPLGKPPTGPIDLVDDPPTPRNGNPITSPVELAEGEAAVAHLGRGLEAELPEADDDEPLELDDGRPPAKRAPKPPAPPARRKVERPPPEKKVFDLGDPDADIDSIVGAGTVERYSISQVEEVAPEDVEVVEELTGATSESLPDDAILTPQAEDLAVPESDDILERTGMYQIVQDLPPKPPERKIAPPPARKPAPKAADEIEIEAAPVRPKGSAPLADLLSSDSDSEEEIELLSISSDEELAGPRPTAPASPPTEEIELDSAFGKLSQGPKRDLRIPPKKVPLFDDLSPGAFVELVNRLAYQRYAAGQVILRDGDPGSSFYVIVEGKVRVYKTGADGAEVTLATLGEGTFFGEMALLSGAPRAASIVAEEDTGLLEVTDTVLREVAAHHPQIIESLRSFYRQRLLSNVMAISPLFRDFDPAQRKEIIQKFRMRQAAAGDVIIPQGKISDGLYIVLHGSVEVTTVRGGKTVSLATLKEGEIFGEMSLLTRKAANATVTATGNAILLRLPRDGFQELIVTYPQILALVSELHERRSR